MKKIIISTILLVFSLTPGNSNANPIAIGLTGLAVLGVVGATTYVSQHPGSVGDIASAAGQLAVNAYAYNAAYTSAVTGMVYAAVAEGTIAIQKFQSLLNSQLYPNLTPAMNSIMSPELVDVNTAIPPGNIFASNGYQYTLTGPFVYVEEYCGNPPANCGVPVGGIPWAELYECTKIPADSHCSQGGYAHDHAPCTKVTSGTPNFPPNVLPNNPATIDAAIAGAAQPVRDDFNKLIAANPQAVQWTGQAPTAQQVNNQSQADALTAFNNAATKINNIAAANPTDNAAQIAAANATAAQQAATAQANAAQAQQAQQNMGPYSGTGATLNFNEWQNIQTAIQKTLPCQYINGLLSYISAFNVGGSAPVFVLPMGSYGNINCDLSIFNSVVSTFKLLITLFFNVGMILVTIKLWSRWG